MTQRQSVIIVEDEPLILMMVEQMAEDLGLVVAGCAFSEADAVALLECTTPDIAILDVKLGANTSLAVAAACKDRGIRVIFTTGFSPDAYGNFSDGQPVLNKPFTLDDLREALESGGVRGERQVPGSCSLA
ncbi:response regulator [Devosia sp. CAU 1758]